MAQTLTQPKGSLTSSAGKTVRVWCQVKDVQISDTNPIHWYQQKAGQPIARILYFGNSVERDPGFGTSFNGGKTTDTAFYLAIELTADKSATYYCACWVYTACNRNTISAQKARTPVCT